MMVRNVLLCGIAFALLARSGPSNLVQNGSFSTDDFTSWTTHNCTVGCAFGSWMVTASLPSDPGTHPPGGSEAATTGCNSGATPACNDPVSGTTFSQTLTTAPGQTYTLGFYFDGGGSAATGPAELEVLWNGSPVPGGTIVNPASSTWTIYTFTVTATGSSTVLEFTGKQNPGQLYVTGISVTATSGPPATPIPGTLLLAIVGVAGLALYRFGLRPAPALTHSTQDHLHFEP
jgi:hypothetical protein